MRNTVGTSRSSGYNGVKTRTPTERAVPSGSGKQADGWQWENAKGGYSIFDRELHNEADCVYHCMIIAEYIERFL